MILPFLSALLVSAAPEPCAVPESMPAPSEAMAGEGDPDWCLDGADPFAIAGPDGPPRQMVWQDHDLDIASIVQWRRGAPHVQLAGWRLAFTRPAKNNAQGELREILIQKLGDNVLVVTTNPAWRIGNAICSGEGGPSIGFLREGAELSAADRDAIAQMTDGSSDMEPGNIMCTLFTLDGDGWRGRFRGPQGRPLPEIDDYYSGTRMRVTPPGDYDRYLRFSR